MKMFLTRLGFNSKMIVNGDISQIDLPRNVKSGLIDAQENSRIFIRLTLFIFQLRMWFAIQLSLRLSELMNQYRLKKKSVKKTKKKQNSKKEQFRWNCSFFYLIIRFFILVHQLEYVFYRGLGLLEDWLSNLDKW